MDARDTRGEKLSGEERKGGGFSQVRGFKLAKIRIGLTIIGVEVSRLGWVEKCQFIVSSCLETLVGA